MNTPIRSDGENGLAGLEIVGNAVRGRPRKRFERPSNLAGNIDRMIEDAREESEN